MEDKKIDFGFIKSNTLYRDVKQEENGLELAALNEENQETTIGFFVEEWNKLFKSFEALNKQINDTENKGSFLIKLQNLKAKLSSHKGLGDYDSIESQITNQESLIKDIVKQNRARNTDIKKALMLELDEALKNNDFYEVGLAIKDIKQRWIKTGRASDDIYEMLEADFTSKTQAFYDKRQSFFDDKMKLQAAKVHKYEAIVKKLREINKKSGLKNEVENVKGLQAEWKDLGKIPEKDYKPLNTNYWNECQQFFDAVKKERKAENTLSKESLSNNLSIKKGLLEQLKTLEGKALQDNIGKELNELKGKWKATGKTSKDASASINDSYYELNGLIMEKQFIYNLAFKKFKSFASDNSDQRTFLLKKLTRDLLSRDKGDLAAFRENMEKMHVNKGSFVDMLEAKLKLYERKVALKTKILSALK